MGASRTSNRTGQILVQIWLADDYREGPRHLGEISRVSVHAPQHGNGDGTRRRNGRGNGGGISFRHFRAANQFELFGKREVTALGWSFCLWLLLAADPGGSASLSSQRDAGSDEDERERCAQDFRRDAV